MRLSMTAVSVEVNVSGILMRAVICRKCWQQSVVYKLYDRVNNTILQKGVARYG